MKLKTPTFILSALALTFGALAAEDKPTARTLEWPVAPGAVFAQRDNNNVTPMVGFDAKGRSLLAYNCRTRGRALTGRHYELICDGGSFHAMNVGAWIGAKVAGSGAFTVELTMTAAVANPASTGVIFAFGDDETENFALLQDKAGLLMRLGKEKLVDLFAIEAGKPVHVLIACDQKAWTAYRDGKEAGSGKMPEGAPAWGTRQVTMGADWAGQEQWQGRLEAIAVFPRALTAKEAADEATASDALRTDRKPIETIRFRGSLLRQAKTSKLEAIRPYTRSMSAAEYKVDEVLEGKWSQPTINVLHWMIMDGKRLPIADRQAGAKVELRVELLDEHPQLKSCRRDELTDGDIDAELFYCESECR